MSECYECANTGWVCGGECPNKRADHDCKNPLRCQKCYRRSRFAVAYLDSPTKPANVQTYLCGHGAVWAWRSVTECPRCAEETQQLARRADFEARSAERRGIA